MYKKFTVFKMKNIYILTFIFSIIFRVLSTTRIKLDPKYFQAVDVERFSKDFDVKITVFDGYNTKKNNTPVVYGELYQQIFLSCEPNDHLANANVFWKHNSKLLNVPPPYRIPWSKGSILMVRPLLKGRNDGLYECIAISKTRGMVKRGIIINVLTSHHLPSGFPKVITHPRNIHSIRRQVDFNCIISGEAPLKIVWYKDRRPVLNDKNHRSSMSMVNKNFSSNLMINNVSERDSGFYQCVATNAHGQVASKQANINFVIKRFRKNAQPFDFIDIDQPYIGKCKGTDGTPDEYPGPATIKMIDCEKTVSKEFSILIGWTVGKKVKLIRFFQVVFQINGQLICFKVPKTGRQFFFTKELGFRLDTEYKVSVVTHPVSDSVSSTMLGISKDICNYNISRLKEKKSASGVPDDNEPDVTDSPLIPVLAGVGGGTIICLLVFAVIRQWKVRHIIAEKVNIQETSNIYVSHCSMNNREKEKVLKFFGDLNLYGIQVTADLFNLTFMDNNGGPSQWIPQYISLATKILMIITPSYLRIIKSSDMVSHKNINEARKVRSEFLHISDRLYNGNVQVIVILDSHVKQTDLPPVLQCCPVLPYIRNIDENNDKTRRLLGLILEQEPIQYR